MRLHARGMFPEAAPFERVATAEAGLVRQGADRVLGALLGAHGRDLAYRFFVGEYFYVNTNPGGTIAVGATMRATWEKDGRGRAGTRAAPGSDGRCSPAPAWSCRSPAPRPYRPCSPRACRDAGEPDLHRHRQRHCGGRGPSGPRWSDVSFTLPAAALVAGENQVCFQFARGSGEEGEQVGAQVSRVQLP